jgi:hypothetical protein
VLIGAPPAAAGTVDRVRRTVALLERRGYAGGPRRLGEVCLGGSLSEVDVRAAVAAAPDLRDEEGLVHSAGTGLALPEVVARRDGHARHRLCYLEATRSFAAALAAACPHILSISVAGSLASGGFRASDDVDLNLVVGDGSRHLAYAALNVLGLLHSLRHRDRPVDAHTRRPLAPRLMTANLILERSECFPLGRQDEDMAYEMLIAEPVFGAAFQQRLIAANPGLVEHFPQLAGKPAPFEVAADRRLPDWALPLGLEGAARRLGRAGWRYMQWTRRHRPEAQARVAFVRRTMRPYVLFPDL